MVIDMSGNLAPNNFFLGYFPSGASKGACPLGCQYSSHPGAFLHIYPGDFHTGPLFPLFQDFILF